MKLFNRPAASLGSLRLPFPIHRHCPAGWLGCALLGAAVSMAGPAAARAQVTTDLVITTNTTWTNLACAVEGNLVVSNGATLALAGGVTLTVSGELRVEGSNTVLQARGLNRGGGTSGQGVTICASNLLVGAGARISADGWGYQATPTNGLGPGAGGYYSSGSYYGGGGGHGGKGGTSSDSRALGGGVNGSATEPVGLGSSGGYGGDGGGAIRLEVTNRLWLDGVISANGSNAVNGPGGGGAGGSVYARVGELTGQGVFQADGGAGKPYLGGGGGGGGGGRVAVYYQGGSYASWTNCTARGGGGYNPGDPGSVQFYDTGATNLRVGTYWDLPSGAAAYGQVTLRDNAVLTVRAGAVLAAGQMVLGSNATVNLMGGVLECAGALVAPLGSRLIVTNGARLAAGELGLASGATGWLEGGSVLDIAGTFWLSNNALLQCVGRNGTVGSNGVGVVIQAGDLTVATGARISADAWGYRATPTNGLGPRRGRIFKLWRLLWRRRRPWREGGKQFRLPRPGRRK